MSPLDDLAGPSLRATWRRTAAAVGGTYHEWGFPPRLAVQLHSGDWTITLDTFSGGARSFTRVRAPFANPEAFRCQVARRSLFTWLGRFFNRQDVEVGHRGFDHEFVVQGNSLATLKRLLSNHQVRLLLLRQKYVSFEVRPESDSRFPPGVDLLQFTCPGSVKDDYRLTSLFELFDAALRELCWGGDQPSGAATNMRRLAVPGGQVERNYVRWDGDRVRREGAVALTQIRAPKSVPALVAALDGGDHYDPILRARVIEALAAIGDPAAVGPLVRLLGNARDAEGRPIRELAARALRTLGEGRLAEAVALALSGDRQSLDQAARRYRDEVIDACASALGGAAPAHAAKALEVLRATRALPSLRAALRLHGRRSAAGAAIDAAIFSLEALTVLPRAADGAELTRDTLPRPAGTTPAASDTLPRVADARGRRGDGSSSYTK